MALEFYEQSLSILQNLNEPTLKVLTLNRLGDVYEALAKYQQSFEFYNQALPFLDKLDKPSLKALALNNLGNAYYILGDREQAFNFYNQALPLWRRSQNQADTFNLERFNYSLSANNLESETPRLILTLVLPYYQTRSPDLSSTKSNAYKSYIDLASYFASKQKYQEFYINLLMQLHQQNPTQGYDVLALQASERSRARSLRTLMNPRG